MYKQCYPEANAFLAINTLVNEINSKPNFMAFGLCNKKNELIGISTGYAIENKCFYFSGFYVKIKNTINTKNLIELSLAQVEELMFDKWECDTHNKNMQSMLEKYGAKLKSVRLVGEF
jgi:uncharacterized membrane protein